MTAENCGVASGATTLQEKLRIGVNRTDMVAQHMDVTTATALRNYIDDSWGQEMAERFWQTSRPARSGSPRHRTRCSRRGS